MKYQQLDADTLAFEVHNHFGYKTLESWYYNPHSIVDKFWQELSYLLNGVNIEALKDAGKYIVETRQVLSINKLMEVE